MALISRASNRYSSSGASSDSATPSGSQSRSSTRAMSSTAGAPMRQVSHRAHASAADRLPFGPADERAPVTGTPKVFKASQRWGHRRRTAEETQQEDPP